MRTHGSLGLCLLLHSLKIKPRVLTDPCAIAIRCMQCSTLSFHNILGCIDAGYSVEEKFEFEAFNSDMWNVFTKLWKLLGVQEMLCMQVVNMLLVN